MRDARLLMPWVMFSFWLGGPAVASWIERAEETFPDTGSSRVAASTKKQKRSKRKKSRKPSHVESTTTASDREDEPEGLEEEIEGASSSSSPDNPLQSIAPGGLEIDRGVSPATPTVPASPVRAGSRSDYGFRESSSSSPGSSPGEWRQLVDPNAQPGRASGPAGDGYPKPEIARPLSLPRGMTELRLAFLLAVEAADPRPGIGAGFGLGIARNTEMGLTVPFFLMPKAGLADLNPYILYEWTPHIGVPPLKLATRLSFFVPISQEYTGFPPHKVAFLLDMPLKVELTGALELIFDPGVGLALGGGARSLLLFLDGGVGVQILDPLVVEVLSGAHLFLGGPMARTEVPLKTRIQCTLFAGLDLYLEGGFPDLQGAGTGSLEGALGVDFRF